MTASETTAGLELRLKVQLMQVPINRSFFTNEINQRIGHAALDLAFISNDLRTNVLSLIRWNSHVSTKLVANRDRGREKSFISN